jgi:hypothetical protein
MRKDARERLQARHTKKDDSMGMLDFLKCGIKCSECGQKNKLHRRNPPLCEKCYWRFYRDKKNTGLVKKRRT